MKKYAGIDIGSNTIRMIIGSFSDLALITEKKYLSITRLGKDFHKTGELSAGSIKNSLDTLFTFSQKIKKHDVDNVSVVATGVLRAAKNAKDFVDEVSDKTGLKIEIISGDREAYLTALGVKTVLHLKDSVIFDVGGGSTEFILSRGDSMQVVKSIDIGAVTLFERFVNDDPPGKSELDEMNDHVSEEIKILVEKSFNEYDACDLSLIFTAGTATTLAAVKLRMDKYDPDRINGVKMTYGDIQSLYNEFVSLRSDEREKIIGLEKGREDIIISGTCIALKVMEALKKDDVIISAAGLLEGIVIDCYKNP
jgi:exopolyphosphatase/guanosine-5'-triphosphate,3'-diphosphate pyrophosphatase